MGSKPVQKSTMQLVSTQPVLSILHQQFQELGCYAQVVAHLKDGFSFGYVRELIQEKNQEWLSLPPQLVLERIGKLHFELSTLGTVAPFLPGYVEEAAQQIENGLDEVAEMVALYRLQMERIQIAVNLEKSMKLLSPHTVREIRMAKEILEASEAIKSHIGLYTNKKGTMGQPQVPVAPGQYEPVTLKSTSKILGVVKLLMEKAK